MASALDGIIEGILRRGLDVKGGRLRLVSCATRRFRLTSSTDGLEANRFRLVLNSPTLIKSGEHICFDPPVLGNLILGQAMIRCASIYNAFYARNGQERIRSSTRSGLEW